MLTFNDLLEKANIDPASVLVMRHRPTEVSLRRILPWCAVERPDLFNAYQRAQGAKNAELALKRAEYLAAFIGLETGKAHFAGLYRQKAFRTIEPDEYLNLPGNSELHAFGMSSAWTREAA